MEHKRYLVSVGDFENERNALIRKKLCLDNGIGAEILDSENTTMTDIVTALTLIAVKLDKLIDAVESRPAEEPKKPETLGELIKAERTKRGLSQKQLAEECGLSAFTICQIERDEQDSPRMKTLVSVATALGIDFNEIVALLPEK